MKNKNGKRFCVVSDTHGDMIDPIAEAGFFSWLDDYDPEIRIHAGDLFDFRAIRNGAGVAEKQESMSSDFQAGMEFADAFFKGGKKNIYLRGNHSFSKDSEFLTDRGWVNVSEVSEHDKVAQFDINSGEVSFDNPISLVNHHEDFIYEVEGRFSRQKVSSLHDVVVGREKHKAINLIGREIKESEIKVSGFYNGSNEFISEKWVELLTWVVMDGCIVNLKKYDPETTKARIQFKLSKQRKIDALKKLLDEIGIKYTFSLCKKYGVNKLQPYYIRIYGDQAREIVEKLGGRKTIPSSWMWLPRSHLDVFLKTLIETDGNSHYSNIAWATTDKNSVDVIQSWCVLQGVDFAYRELENASGFPNSNLQYSCKISYNSIEHHNSNLRIEEKPYNNTVYCVTMPMGTVISRVGGKVAFTGNCERLWDLTKVDGGPLFDHAELLIAGIQKKMNSLKATMLPYDARLGVLQIGHLRVIHGYFSGRNAATQHARIYGNCIFGHTHSQDIIPVESLDGPSVAMGTGCLCKIDMHYNARQPNKLRHQQGWVYGTLFDDGTYQAFQAKRIGDHFHAATEFKTY